MCLITEQKEAIITTEDMVVYKLLDTLPTGVIRSPYEWFHYNIGQLYETEIKDQEGRYVWCCADTTDHDWLTKNYPEWEDYKSADRKKLKCLAQGFHTMGNIERAEAQTSCRHSDIYQCTIPAGSEVYKDATGLLVSNKIIIDKKL